MKIIYYVSYLIKKVFLKLFDIFNDWACKNYVICDKGTRFKNTATVDNISRNKLNIAIGKFSIIRGELLTFQHGGKIIIGDYCYLGEQSRIWSSVNIKIGNRVLIAHNVNIHDNNAHPIDSEQRHNQFKQIISEKCHPKEDKTLNEKSIIIEDDVWIGFNSTILKGVTIGKGSIVAACTVITKDVPPNVIIAGNPAQIIKYLK